MRAVRRCDMSRQVTVIPIVHTLTQEHPRRGTQRVLGGEDKVLVTVLENGYFIDQYPADPQALVAGREAAREALAAAVSQESSTQAHSQLDDDDDE